MMHLSKTAQVLKFFAQQLPRGVGRTRLLKLTYLADLEARKHLGHPISELEYRWWDYGPFDEGYYHAIEELEDAGLVEQDEIHYDDVYMKKLVVDLGEAAPFDFTAAEARVLGFVAETFLRTKLNDLLNDVVYETMPMKKVQSKGERLPMEEQDNVEKERVGFDLERVLEAERELDEGNFATAEEFFDGLRAEIRSAGSGGRA